MKLRLSLFALLVASPMAVADAQACIGSFALPPSGATNFYISGQVDEADFSSGSGLRLGVVTNNQKAGAFNFHFGYRTYTYDFGTETSAIDLNFLGGFPGKNALSRAGCFVVGLDAEFDENDSGIMDTYVGMSFGHDFILGPVALVPFATLGINGATVIDTEEEEYSGLTELGFGVRIGNRLTATVSSRTIHSEFERNVTRLVLAFPLGSR